MGELKPPIDAPTPNSKDDAKFEMTEEEERELAELLESD